MAERNRAADRSRGRLLPCARRSPWSRLPGHIAVHDGAAYRALLAGQHWSPLQIEDLPSRYPLFARLGRWLMRAPAIGGLFRFRILMMATK